MKLTSVVLLALTLVACADDPERCDTNSECQLVWKDCCGLGSDSLEGVYAAHVGSKDAREGAPQCRGGTFNCPVQLLTFEPLAPKPHAVCVAHQCSVIDLRQNEITRCTQDSDCHLASPGCCAPCSKEPNYWTSVNTSGDAFLQCDPKPACTLCIAPSFPQSYCASDGHCALRN